MVFLLICLFLHNGSKDGVLGAFLQNGAAVGPFLPACFSGGISIKPSAGMGLMRGDMGGAACVLGAIESIAKMELPVNLTVLVPLVENMPSGSATNPGDVFTAMNGKTVEVLRNFDYFVW